MTNDELLAEINKEIQPCGTHTHFECKSKEENLPWQALRAVVELHKPMPSQFKEGAISCFECSTMDYDVYWDECSTIKAIKGELND